jgi:hypothetical protein
MNLVLVLLFILTLGGDADFKPMQKFLATEFRVFTSNDSLQLGVNTKTPMANPGASFNATDRVENVTLPFQRLLFGGRSDSLWFVCYEQGGRGHSWHLVLFTIHTGRKTVSPLANYYWLDPSWRVATVDSLKQFLRTALTGDNGPVGVDVLPKIYLSKHR